MNSNAKSDTPSCVAEKAGLLPAPPTRPLVISAIALGIAVIGLGLAVIPAIITGQPLPAPFAASVKPPEPAPAPKASQEESSGSVTLKYKSFSVTLGRNKNNAKAQQQQPVSEADTADVPAADLLRWFTIAAIGLALVSLVVAPVAQVREKHTVFTTIAIACSIVAITWQYVAVGIVIGIAVIVVLVIVSKIGSALS